MMFKVLVIQAANNLSDERAEYLVNDRLSFMRFLGLGLGDRVRDAHTIWTPPRTSQPDPRCGVMSVGSDEDRRCGARRGS